jgi:hypothetical protein
MKQGFKTVALLMAGALALLGCLKRYFPPVAAE